MNASDCFFYSGPNCSEGYSHWAEQCLQQYPGTVRGDYQWAQCVLSSSTQFEQFLYAERAYILTLWPAFIGFLCGIGPDPAAMVFDNVWWAALFAVTCGGLPGLDPRKPRHHTVVESVREGRTICEDHLEDIDSRRPQVVPRLFDRPNEKRIKSAVRLEWTGHIFGWVCWIGFNITFVIALRQSAVDGPPFGAAAGFWYWLSPFPAVLTIVSEVFQNRVELYEPLDHNADAPAEIDTPDEPLMSPSREARGAEPQIQLPALNTPKDNDSMATTTTRATEDGPPHDTRYQLHSHNSSFNMWLRIIQLQYQRKSYRLLVKAEDDRWPFLICKWVSTLSRVALFAVGSTTMGSIILMPSEYVKTTFVLLVFVTATPRVLFFDVWRNKARGANLVVMCHQRNDDLYPSAAITKGPSGATKTRTVDRLQTRC